MARGIGLDWNYSHPSEIFDEMAGCLPSLKNITWARVDREESVTYPCDAADKPGNEIIFGDRFPTKSGRAKIVPADVSPPAELPDEGLSVGADDGPHAGALAHGFDDAARDEPRRHRAGSHRRA